MARLATCAAACRSVELNAASRIVAGMKCTTMPKTDCLLVGVDYVMVNRADEHEIAESVPFFLRLTGVVACLPGLTGLYLADAPGNLAARVVYKGESPVWEGTHVSRNCEETFDRGYRWLPHQTISDGSGCFCITQPADRFRPKPAICVLGQRIRERKTLPDSLILVKTIPFMSTGCPVASIYLVVLSGFRPDAQRASAVWRLSGGLRTALLPRFDTDV